MSIARRQECTRQKTKFFPSPFSLMQAAPTERRITERHDRSVANRTANLILIPFLGLPFTATLLQTRGHVSLALTDPLLDKHKFPA